MKFLPAQNGEAGKRRFIQEARAASALDHPNIGSIYGVEETPEGQLYIVMAYYGGEESQAVEPSRLNDFAPTKTMPEEGAKFEAGTQLVM